MSKVLVVLVVAAVLVIGAAPQVAGADGADAACPGATSATHDLIVPAGATCVIGGSDSIGHDVVVGAGATFLDQGATVGNDIRATAAAAIGIGFNGTVGNDIVVDGTTGALSGGDNYVCNMHVGGDVLIENSAATAGQWFVGDDPECTRGGLTIAHDLVVRDNATHVDVSENGTNSGSDQPGQIGHDLVVTGNSGATVEGNVVGNDATCTPAPSSDGDAKANSVGGSDKGCDGPWLSVPSGYTATPLVVDGQVQRFNLGATLGFDSAGNLLVGTISAANVGGSCAPNGGALYRVNADGTSTEVAGTSSGLMAPSGFAVGSAGAWGTQTYVVDSNAGAGDCSGRVFRVESDGTLTTISNHSIPPLADEPRGIAFGDGALWIAEATTQPNVNTQPNSGQIERIGAPGDFPQIVAQGFPLGDPSSIAFGAGGAYGNDLYIADLGEQAAGGPPSAILRMDASGNVSVFADTSNSPDGKLGVSRVTFAPPGPFGGSLYATNNIVGATGERQVVSVDPSGTITPFATLVGNNPNEYINNGIVAPDGQTMYVMMLDYSFLNVNGQTQGTTIIWRITPNKPPPPADTTPPSISCGAADGAWHADNVSIACTASDDGSGLADGGDASFSLSTSIAAGDDSADAATGARQVCDGAGNCATAGPIDGNKVDRKAPTVAIAAPADGTSFILNGASTLVDYACADSGSGVDSCAGSAANGSAVDTSSVGTKTLTVTATDAVGHTASASSTYWVRYAGGGSCGGSAGHQILQPINADGSSVFKQGSTVPAKFRVCDANGIPVGTPGVVAGFRLVETIAADVAAVNEPVSSTTPDTSFRWDPTGRQWIFNISTKSLAGNATYVYRITLDDGSTIDFRFKLK